ncbi:MAG: peptide chain release factor N(5)-glutamine methyltransferase [Eubacterium sp.]
MTLKEAYQYCCDYLKNADLDEADFKAMCVACNAAGVKNSSYLINKNREFDFSGIESLLKRLKSREPLQYVLGKWDFLDGEFYVGNGVLIPRPETEELVQLAISYIKKLGECIVYDLCAGSGCIGVSVARACPSAKIFLVEKSSDACYYLKKNAQGISNAEIICGDINNTDGLPKAEVIISNPPYIKTDELSSLEQEVLQEPIMALDGGTDGFDFYRIINDKWACMLKKDGALFLEIGEAQGEEIKAVLSNFTDVQVIKDLYNNDRIVTARKNR